jgi:hypothetical protein
MHPTEFLIAVLVVMVILLLLNLYGSSLFEGMQDGSRDDIYQAESIGIAPKGDIAHY